MSIKWPLALLVLLFPLGILIWQKFAKNRKKLPKFVTDSALIEKLPSYKKVKTRLRRLRFIESSLVLLLLIGLSILVARPVMPVNTYSTEKSRDIVILLDVSGSVKPVIPDMLDSIKEIIRQNPGERFSIVTFSGLGNTVMPLTRDPVAIDDTLNLLYRVYKDNNDPDYQFSDRNGGGTDIGEGVLTAVNRFDNLEQYKSRNIIILSDMEQSGGNLDKNSEFYMEKVSLITKYRINFFVLQTPTDYEGGVSTEIMDSTGATVYKVDKDNQHESVRQMSTKIFDQILNSSVSAGKNYMDSPAYVLLSVILLSLALAGLRYFRWYKL